MSEPEDHAATVARLERRLAREKSARHQAEAIAERVASERWELRQQLEEKLALRTSELEAARRAASEAVTDSERRLAALTHDLRTPLTALFFMAESLSEETSLSAQQLAELRNLLAQMRGALDVAAAAAGTDGARERVPLADLVAAYEGGWHQLAARSGKLLILHSDAPPGQVYPGSPDEFDRQVLLLIRERLNGDDPVIDVHLAVGPAGLELR
ncbi:MAG: histidine kinase dimerization/phospho-acceptor domain-containing protein [Actinomycetota bacterium]|uniref:histidine kinase dimerization/phospho-acceptor domain-containing protein n=1 Tax=Mycobacterium sp. G7A2 TaxID=3317307 RepID=UPI002EA4580F|nr:histidine kinase dimerization/phospho-acceptor domain-containing protein [Actinomycetota bacterium]